MSSRFHYDYCTLPDLKKDIRLFELLDQEPDEHGQFLADEPVAGKLSIAPRNCDIDYAALSYVWGVQGDRTEKRMRIDVGDKSYFLDIPEKLDITLRGLRGHKACQNKLLWIDYICINQDERDARREKDYQVPLMSTIYGEAKTVYIWLGGSADDSDVVFDFLRDHVLDLTKFRELGSAKYLDHWDALSKVITRPWFTRRWVVQEVALARDAQVLCGRKSISWAEFADGVTLFEILEKAKVISKVKTGDKNSNFVPDYYGEIEALGAVQLSRMTNNLFTELSGQARSAKLSLEYLVSTFTPFSASNPRDIIYALLSLAKDTDPQADVLEKDDEETWPPRERRALEVFSPEFRRRIEALGRGFDSQPFKVDYKQTISQVYVDCVKFIIKAAKKTHPASALDIICRPWAPQPVIKGHRDSDLHQRATYAKPEPGQSPDFVRTDVERNSLPSWIPNVNGGSHGIDKRNNTMSRKNSDMLVGLPPSPNYSASGRRQIVKDFRFESFVTEHSHNPDLIGLPCHSMFVEGFVLDEVGSDLGDHATKGMIPPNWSDVSQCLDEPYPKDKWQAYWRTLVADRDPNGQNPARIYPRMTMHALNQGLEGEPKDLRSIELYDTCREVSELVKRVQAVIWKKRLARSRDLDCLMLLPERARKGDLICILYGCSVPVVLRRFEKKPEEMLSEERQRNKKAFGSFQNAVLNRRQSHVKPGVKRKFTGTSAGPSKLSTTQMQASTSKVSSGSDESPVSPHSLEIVAASVKPTRLSSIATDPPPTLSQSSAADAQTKNPPALDSPAIRINVSDPFDETSPFPQTTEHLFPPDPPLRPVVRPRANSYASSYTPDEIRTLETRQDKGLFFEFIGECYVHGMMTGEALNEQRNRNLRVQIFELR